MPSLLGRIEAVYVVLEGRRSKRGARAWFARQARVRPYTVSRWLSGQRAFHGPALALLEELERRAQEQSRIKKGEDS